MEVQHDFNFNEPLELTEIFRFPVGEGQNQEFTGKIYIGWEDIKLIKSYPFVDNWEENKGPKFYLFTHNHPEFLILGDMDQLTAYWKAFRLKYPLFRSQEKDGDD